MYQENYEMLASTIAVQATKDYRRASTPQMRNTLKRFFFSEWFRTLTDANGQVIYKRLYHERTCKAKEKTTIRSTDTLSLVCTGLEPVDTI